MEHYEIMEQIGCVAFGAVILVHHKFENKKYVLKKIILVQQTSVARDRLIKKKQRLVRKYHQVGPRNFATRRDSSSMDWDIKLNGRNSGS
ncbi:hypothetical protein V6N13_083682 [Hibiscus sabdariffa]|uniref:Protein kinase domain-containing protein n=1 Tax=Hibiscus sabdariffa TaxID=183260 RepID=A0ABR2SZJ6_9ROSI